jgi:hypothetical protein
MFLFYGSGDTTAFQALLNQHNYNGSNGSNIINNNNNKIDNDNDNDNNNDNQSSISSGAQQMSLIGVGFYIYWLFFLICCLLLRS